MAVTELPAESPWKATLHAYWRQSRRPLVSLAFVLPLLIGYEAGVVVLGSQAVRNGADVWLRQFLDLLGFGQYFLLPALTIGLLLSWHHMTRDRWRLSARVLYTMFAECAVLALGLVLAGRLQGLVVQQLLGAGGAEAAHSALGSGADRAAVLGAVLGFVGAGVYEEVLFRLLLLPGIALCLARAGAAHGVRTASAVVLTSLVFAAAHYLGPHGESFDGFSFWFRFTAGAVFAALFVYRGFGIAAGTHALYDIFVTLG